jgi:hypothetical protein
MMHGTFRICRISLRQQMQTKLSVPQPPSAPTLMPAQTTVMSAQLRWHKPTPFPMAKTTTHGLAMMKFVSSATQAACVHDANECLDSKMQDSRGCLVKYGACLIIDAHQAGHNGPDAKVPNERACADGSYVCLNTSAGVVTLKPCGTAAKAICHM